MSRRRKAVLLLGLALVLGGIAAADVARREAALQRQLGPFVPVVVATRTLEPGSELTAGALRVRRLPARYAPAGAFASPQSLLGERTATLVPAGADLDPGDLEAAGAEGPGGAPVRRGERVADVVALGAPDLVRAGARVDILVTTDPDRAGRGETVLALEDVEVLAAGPAPEAGAASPTGSGPRVSASLRVTLRQAVYLAAAQSFARELRLLPRASGDRSRGNTGIVVGEEL